MTDRKETKLFAFKLAEKQAQEAKTVPQFKVRDGVAVAACTGPDVLENWREFTSSWQGDKGTYC